ncbi:MAG: type II toxin-antitoxin system Phd/YefM family antitoxin [Planctomycetes bacterium]|nr:type II toxin-antitoxin system Phd/YefM family antitoxin [Planctomycetota bacterium]MCD7898093.1 type II toxin-antitoxin system Phd/YefM family antitoxin [Planctomycetaceae bacterium]
MIRAIKALELRENFKEVCDKVAAGETLIITRPKNRNVVLISENAFNELAAGVARENETHA